MSKEHKGWIGVDLDGTLAHYEGWKDGAIGEPVPLMVEAVKIMLAEGEDVRIVTARAAHRKIDRGGVPGIDEEQVEKIQDWCEKHIGKRLPVQFWKDFEMKVLFDDRAIQIIANGGLPVVEHAYKGLQAAEQLYLSAHWTTTSIPEEQQKVLWENLRNALGIPEGYAPKPESRIIAARSIPKIVPGR